ncbi:S41 family peptidase [Lysobacter silvisoli]|uniref:Tail specific protease domain-containing protein n=1 Tax=Lysobacter silvisoli TaxID=2293254 RepID=A0A371K1N4_9GAMM|nr:S41 family peptidase [Lysobacter silvisoli]RDZ27757.1 hypothetical protein DX914_00860 [Lysobacter silvisoli]
MRIVVAFWLLASMGAAQAAQSLDTVIASAQERAYRSSHVDWPQVRAQAESIERTQGEDAAIAYVLRALGDKHTFYRPPAAAAVATVAPARPIRDPMPVPAIAVARPAQQGIPVLRINAWSGQDQPAAALRVRDALIAALAQSDCGLILDFSANTGGNMWPMVTGLAPLLSQGRLGAFRDAKGVETPIENRDGAIYYDGNAHFLNPSLSRLPPRLPKSIAFVIGPRTASSGEITPILFRGQAGVRYFGAPTAGYSTANTTIRLPNGGLLALTTAATVDRNGQAYEHELVPDVRTEEPIAQAAQWVAAQCRR